MANACDLFHKMMTFGRFNSKARLGQCKEHSACFLKMMFHARLAFIRVIRHVQQFRCLLGCLFVCLTVSNLAPFPELGGGGGLPVPVSTSSM